MEELTNEESDKKMSKKEKADFGFAIRAAEGLLLRVFAQENAGFDVNLSNNSDCRFVYSNLANKFITVYFKVKETVYTKIFFCFYTSPDFNCVQFGLHIISL